MRVDRLVIQGSPWTSTLTTRYLLGDCTTTQEMVSTPRMYARYLYFLIKIVTAITVSLLLRTLLINYITCLTVIPYSITFHHTASYNLNNIILLLNCIIFVAEFRAYFERFGRVMSAEVMFNRETHKSRGFGFIVFELEKGAEHVCAEREHIIDGKVVS